jgi:hypothetical protein
MELGKMIALRLPPDVQADVEAEAKARGMSLATFCRTIIMRARGVPGDSSKTGETSGYDGASLGAMSRGRVKDRRRKVAA